MLLFYYLTQTFLECGEPPVAVAGFGWVDMVDEVEFALFVGDAIDFVVVPEVDYGNLPFILNFEEQIHHFGVVVAVVFRLCIEHDGAIPGVFCVCDYVLDCTCDGQGVEIVYIVTIGDFRGAFLWWHRWLRVGRRRHRH